MAKDANKEMALRKRPLSDAALELLAKMVDERMLLLMPSTMQRHKPHLYSMQSLTATHTSDVPFLFNEAAVDALRKRGYIAHAAKDKVEETLRAVGEQIGRKPANTTDGGRYLAWYDVPYVVTDDGSAAVEALRDRLAEIRDARARSEALPRLIVAGRLDSHGRKLPGVGGVYRIVRETDGRFYVDDVAAPGENKSWFDSYEAAVKGARPQRYIEKEDVAAIDVTLDQHANMRRVTKEFDESVQRAAAQMEAEIAPIRQRYAQRREQMLAQLADEMRIAINGPDATPAPGRKR